MAGGGKKGRIHGPYKKPKIDGVRNEINVTPLVDVCLVLLIIFMVITPLMARGKEVQLPQTNFHAEEKDKKQPVVAIDEEGRIYYETERVADFEELKRRVTDLWESDPEIEMRVYVKADYRLPYEKVYPLIMAVHDMGVSSIDLGTNELKKKKE